MKICSVNGTDIVIFTRNEHCPPHVHVSIKNCDLRLEFSFVHNDVRIWDATPDKNMPKLREIERLCVEMKKRIILREQGKLGCLSLVIFV